VSGAVESLAVFLLAFTHEAGSGKMIFTSKRQGEDFFPHGSF
jgi:hypothetical protein